MCTPSPVAFIKLIMSLGNKKKDGDKGAKGFVSQMINCSPFLMQGSQGFQGFPGANGEKGTRVCQTVFLVFFMDTGVALKTGCCLHFKFINSEVAAWL